MKIDLEKVQSCMEENGWSQNRLAKEMGMSSGAVSKIFHGNRSGISEQFLGGLRKAFPQIPITEFLIDHEEVENHGDTEHEHPADAHQGKAVPAPAESV